jgi:outer membrane protein
VSLIWRAGSEDVKEEKSMGRTIVGLIGTTAVWLGMMSPGWSAETFKVAVMNQQVVIEQSKAGKRAVEELKAYSTARQKIINADEQELKEMQQTIQDGKLEDSEKQEKQAQFQAKVEAYQRRLADFNREIQQKQRQMVDEYSKKVRTAAQAVGERNGYTAIIDKGIDATMKIVLYHQPGLDVTDQIVTEFDRQNK